MVVGYAVITVEGFVLPCVSEAQARRVAWRAGDKWVRVFAL